MPKAGEPVSKTMRTQVGRALAQLGIRHIADYSPEARGRSERAFRTPRDRLPKELRRAGITTMAGANRWIAEVYLPGEILCLQEERRVGNDNAVKWRGLSLQIRSSPLRPHFVRATVRIHEYPDGRRAIFHGPHRLADCDAEGNLRDDTKPAA